MELNEITEKLPPHLMQFVVDQPYEQYTPVDQAVWRYVMRKNFSHLTRVAHESYVKGLKLAGIEIEKIPTMYGMNRILKQIGWAAVAVDGFIPPGAFMEFTAYKVLVIATDIRTIDHIEYTPAPDIIHESAGHAPIISDPDFAKYLIYIGQVGSKAFSSKKDYELYEAIRHLSIIKEDPYTSPDDVLIGEQKIADLQSDMGKPSEMALLRNLHWWTAEYGLIGSVDNHKIYGAGLLSSIGESEACLKPEVKKIPYTLDAVNYNYDITKPQPQLFVTQSFDYLSEVLGQFVQTMAYHTGGPESVRKAIESESIATCILDSGLQISGIFENHLTDDNGEVVYLKTSGATAFAIDNKEIDGQGKNKHKDGVDMPLGKIKQITINSVTSSDIDFRTLQSELNKEMSLEMHSGIVISGVLAETIKSSEGKVLLVKLHQGKINFQGRSLFNNNNSTCCVAIGEKIISAFSGPADIAAFQPVVNVPKEKTHKVIYNTSALKLHKLYGQVRKIRESGNDYEQLPKIAKIVQRYFPKDWLLTLEILELMVTHCPQHETCLDLKTYLLKMKETFPHLAKLIDDGLMLINKV